GAPPAPASPAPKPSLSRRWGRTAAWSLAAAAGAAACALGALPFFAAKDHAVPFSHPTGMIWEGDSLWVTDWEDQALFHLRAGPEGLAVARKYALGDSHPMGLAYARGSFFIVDSWTRTISSWRIAGDKLAQEDSWPSPGPSPSAVFSDGKNLWTADKQTHIIYRHAFDDSLTVLDKFPAGDDPVALFADSKAFWSAGGESRNLYRRILDASLSIAAVYALPELQDGREPLSCVSVKGRKVWLGRDGEFRILERPWWMFRAVKGRTKR
ncbi:MAG: hypothetical protein AAB578_05325, partial [Elusimicrobiota bacterium]